MNSLVADYGDSDEDNSNTHSTTTDDSESEANESSQSTRTSNDQAVLPSASVMLADSKKIIPGGVFSNPFREAEDAKMASLEKHVKMVDPEHEASDQKRKICWSYRKGRCRFGSKCNFAHDSDLILRKELHGSQQVEIMGAEAVDGAHPVEVTPHASTHAKQTNKKKRPGLSKELVPPKKVLKMYHREKYSGKP